MCFRVSSNITALTKAIDDFNPAYHEDYFTVRSEAVDYLSKAPSSVSAERLSRVLIHALQRWGAGERGAPTCQSVDAATRGLCNPTLHENLTKLAASFPFLTLIDDVRRLDVSSPFKAVNDFDESILGTLTELATLVLVGNTNVTYPMKALLLITGLMPAFDSQVRGGLSVAGLSGFGRKEQPRTQYLIPAKGRADAKRICALPFYIAECLAEARPLLNKAIANSKYPMLKGQYGRLFDILLFMQRNLTRETALIWFSPSRPFERWYEI